MLGSGQMVRLEGNMASKNTMRKIDVAVIESAIAGG
jgi:hypothetical protein